MEFWHIIDRSYPHGPAWTMMIARAKRTLLLTRPVMLLEPSDEARLEMQER